MKTALKEYIDEIELYKKDAIQSGNKQMVAAYNVCITLAKHYLKKEKGQIINIRTGGCDCKGCIRYANKYYRETFNIRSDENKNKGNKEK